MEYLSADVLPIYFGLFFRISRYRVEKKEYYNSLNVFQNNSNELHMSTLFLRFLNFPRDCH